MEKFIRNALFVLILTYNGQGYFYEQGSLTSRGALLLVFIISGFYFIKTLLIKESKDLFYWAITSLMLLNSFRYIFSGSMMDPIYISQIKTILLAALPFYPFYYFAKKGLLQHRHLTFFFIILLPVSIANFYYNRDTIISMRITSNEDVVNNEAYSFAFIIPFLFLFNKDKIVTMLLLFIILYFLILGAKRGALIAGIIGAIIFIYYKFKTIKRGYRVLNYIILFLITALLSSLLYEYFTQNDFFFNRITAMIDGDSSGRDIIFAKLFNSWYNNNFINILFGQGFSETIKASGSGHFAHNDWLELLVNFGILGVFIYFLMFLSTIRFIVDRNNLFNERAMMASIVAIWFMSTIFSMNYASPNATYQNIFIAFLLSRYNNHN